MTDADFQIPRAILPFIEAPPLLEEESRQDYNELLAALVQDVEPRDIPEWLWAIDFLNCYWEICRNRLFRVKLVGWQQNLGGGYSPAVAPAMALVKVAPKIEYLDKTIEKLQRRADTILQHLEFRREVFAHRARRAAEKILNGAGQSIIDVTPDVVIDDADQPLPAEKPADDKKTGEDGADPSGPRQRKPARRAR